MLRTQPERVVVPLPRMLLSPSRRSATRTPEWLHDAVVQYIASQERECLVHTNLLGKPLTFFGVGWDKFVETAPDILVCDPETFSVERIIEVETVDTVHRAQVPRWQQIAHTNRLLHQADFWIFVPPTTADAAARLCRTFGIPARIGVWTIQSVTAPLSSLALPPVPAVPVKTG